MIVFVALLSRYFLNLKFKANHYVGILFVLMGIYVVAKSNF